MSTLTIVDNTRVAKWLNLRSSHLSDSVEERQAGRAFQIFSFLWAVAVLFHYAAYPDRIVGLGSFLLTAAAVGVLFRPSSLLQFLAMAWLQVAVVVNTYPTAVSNHWLFAFFVNLTIFVALGRLAFSKQRAVSTGNLFLEFAPVVRVELILLYFFAVLHKLNEDFLNPVVSCATEQYLDLAQNFSFLPTADWVLASLPYATLVVEAAIPLMLCFRRTRIAGVLLGLLFHAFLALNPTHTFYDFSSVVYAAYFLFIPYDYVAKLGTHWSGTALGRWVKGLVDRGLFQNTFRVLMVGLVLVLAVNWVHQFFTYEPIFTVVPGMVEALKIANIVVWAFYATGVILVFTRAARKDRIVQAVGGIDAITLRSVTLALIPLLLIVNGLTPYVGLKTETSFSMFSNLQTEGPYANHLFMPTKYRVAGYQDDLVRIVNTTHPYLQEKAEQGYAFPYVQFKRLISRHRKGSVTYVRDGDLETVAKISEDPQLSRKEPFLSKKLLDFRPVDTNGAGCRCSH